MEAAPGPTIRAQAIPGFLLILGVGHPTTTVAGPSVRESVGVGSRGAPGWGWQTIRLSPPLPPVADRILCPIRRAGLRQLLPESTLVPVNLKAMPASSLTEHDKFVFRNDSAGLGVPRGTLGKLNSFSHQTAEHGMASTNVYFGGPQRGAAEHGGGYYSGPSRSAGPSGSPGMASSPSHSSGMPSGGMQSGMQSASGMGGSHASAPAGGGGGRH